MKRSASISLIIMFCALVLSQSTWASGFRGGFGRPFRGGGFALGYGSGFGYGPFGGYGYGPYGGGFGPYGFNRFGYMYSPPIVTIPAAPPVYIERAQQQPLEPNYWYYCRNPAGYYPYVRECPAGWEKVPPTPPR